MFDMPPEPVRDEPVAHHAVYAGHGPGHDRVRAETARERRWRLIRHHAYAYAAAARRGDRRARDRAESGLAEASVLPIQALWPAHRGRVVHQFGPALRIRKGSLFIRLRLGALAYLPDRAIERLRELGVSLEIGDMRLTEMGDGSLAGLAGVQAPNHPGTTYDQLGGVYLDTERRAFVSNGAAPLTVALHELGHGIGFTTGAQDTPAFEAFYERADAGAWGGGELPDKVEFFADAYMLLFTDPGALRRSVGTDFVRWLRGYALATGVAGSGAGRPR
jgi:hypothetical protein